MALRVTFHVWFDSRAPSCTRQGVQGSNSAWVTKEGGRDGLHKHPKIWKPWGSQSCSLQKPKPGLKLSRAQRNTTISSSSFRLQINCLSLIYIYICFNLFFSVPLCFLQPIRAAVLPQVPWCGKSPCVGSTFYSCHDIVQGSLLKDRLIVVSQEHRQDPYNSTGILQLAMEFLYSGVRMTYEVELTWQFIH